VHDRKTSLDPTSCLIEWPSPGGFVLKKCGLSVGVQPRSGFQTVILILFFSPPSFLRYSTPLQDSRSLQRCYASLSRMVPSSGMTFT
jgi:hypothetical protein